MTKLDDFLKSFGNPPGPPPKPGLQWKYETSRWIRPKSDADLSGQGSKDWVHAWDAKNFTKIARLARIDDGNRLQTIRALKSMAKTRNPGQKELLEAEQWAIKLLSQKNFNEFDKHAGVLNDLYVKHNV